MRYIITIFILWLQLARCFSAEAASILPADNIAHKKPASLITAPYFNDQAAEVAQILQFNCVACTLRDNRDSDAALAAMLQSDHITGELRKRINVLSLAHWSPLIRLLLFPNHYFW